MKYSTVHLPLQFECGNIRGVFRRLILRSRLVCSLCSATPVQADPAIRSIARYKGISRIFSHPRQSSSKQRLAELRNAHSRGAFPTTIATKGPPPFADKPTKGLAGGDVRCPATRVGQGYGYGVTALLS